MHFPGHMTSVILGFKKLYESHNINYENPVREWDTPPDRQFIDQVIINRHAEYSLTDAFVQNRKTTGKYLFSLGILPSENVKGTKLDFNMQHDCYPYVLYNILVFFWYLPWMHYSLFEMRILEIMQDAIKESEKLILGNNLEFQK